MYAGPRIRERYGNRARKLYWFATAIIMILIANGGLLTVRYYLSNAGLQENSLAYEIWFLFVAVIVSMALIFRRIRARRRDGHNKNCSANNEQRED